MKQGFYVLVAAAFLGGLTCGILVMPDHGKEWQAVAMKWKANSDQFEKIANESQEIARNSQSQTKRAIDVAEKCMATLDRKKPSL